MTTAIATCAIPVSASEDPTPASYHANHDKQDESGERANKGPFGRSGAARVPVGTRRLWS
jgi:hypothetical protein